GVPGPPVPPGPFLPPGSCSRASAGPHVNRAAAPGRSFRARPGAPPPMPPKSTDRLERYKSKRSAGRTPEPFGGSQVPATGRLFVFHKHHARNLHWDLRLEWEGALESWAVPKGPSPNPADKRLAMHVEPHPLDY